LNVDINHIGVQQMTTANRPLAALLVAAMFALLWVPTLSVPAQAAAASPQAVDLA
jgi:hypothetical protein